MDEPKVLAEIFSILKRLESRLQTQSSRLDYIELSIRSEPSDPGQLSSSNVPINDTLVHKTLPKIPSPMTRSSSLNEASAASSYEASIRRLRRRFEFLDDSDSEVLESPDTPGHDPQEKAIRVSLPIPHFARNATPSNEVSEKLDGDDLASRVNQNRNSWSYYSPTHLSRQNLDIFSAANRGAPVETRVEPSAMALLSTPPCEQPPSGVSITRSSTRRSRRSGRTFHSKVSSTTTVSSHEKAEIMLYAYDNFKHSLLSSRPFRSKERLSVREEKRRLRLLANEESRANKSKELEASISRLQNLLQKWFKNASTRTYGTVSFVA